MPAPCGQGRETHRSGLKPVFRQQNTGAAVPVKKDYIPRFLANRYPGKLEFVNL